jgi:YHS domain-containing protein
VNNRRLFISAIAMQGLSLLTFGQTRSLRPRPERVRDPVCGIMVEKDPTLSTVYQGRTYYFCSKADRDTFTRNAQKYLKAQPSRQE